MSAARTARPMLREGETCVRVARADRAALLIDMACYFDAAKTAMQKAHRSIHFLNWAFEHDTQFHPEPGGGGKPDDQIGNFLKALAAAKPELDIRILCWKSAMPVAATQRFFPIGDRSAFVGTPVKFVLDGKLPLGACHHQKMLVIDDALAFCGGGDIGPDRWDTPEHLDDNPRREKTRRDNRCFDSRHEVMAIVDGDAAKALGQIFRDRWLRCTGETLEPREGRTPAWPRAVTPDFRGIQVGLSRTSPRWRKYPEVREVETLHLEAIEAARRVIYMENQYFTSPVIAAALARRLRGRNPPEVVLISTEHAPSYFDQATMDKTRSNFIERLAKADHAGRFRMYSPVTTLGLTIIVHAKLTIVDDVLLRVGSANINNRSMGFDTECDLSIEAGDDSAAQARIAALRLRLLSHWLGCADEVLASAIEAEGGLIGGLEALRTHGYARLRPIKPEPMNPVSAVVAQYHLGDPVGPSDSWRPWLRRRALERQLAKLSRS